MRSDSSQYRKPTKQCIALLIVCILYVCPCRRHPHKHAEIFSYILAGSLSHADSMGTKESLPRGCVQYMSAGRGVSHSVSSSCTARRNVSY
jgi:uncharacterized cupin superfamily protein